MENAPDNNAARGEGDQVNLRVIPLSQEGRHALDTTTAAAHLNRSPQTLRNWASQDNGPLRPIRINGRLAWKCEDLRKVLGVSQ